MSTAMSSTSSHGKRTRELNNSIFIQLAVFVLVLVALNFFFHWHISIVGSLVLTIVVSLVMRMMQPR